MNTSLIRSKENIRNYCEVFTPTNIVTKICDLIPSNIWSDPTYTFLEPSCGNGQFIIEIIKKRISYGILPEIAISTIIGLDKLSDNIDECIDRIHELTKIDTSVISKYIFQVNDSIEYINTNNIQSIKLVVLGNPPYHIIDGGGTGYSAVPVYKTFIDTIITKLTPAYFSMIVPSRWMVCGKGLTEFRHNMMNDRHIKLINHFPGQSDIFTDVIIKGGVNIFLWERDYNGQCEFIVGNTRTSRYLNKYDIIIQDNNSINILDKIISKTTTWVSDTCVGRDPFKIPSNFTEWMSSGVECYTANKIIRYVDINGYTDKNYIINKWKVCTSKGINPNPDTGAFEKYNNIFIAKPNQICSDTYLIVNTFDSELEAINFIIYMQTNLFKFLLGLRVTTQNMTYSSFKWVPDMNNYLVKYTDDMLYNIFNFTIDEINYINYSKYKK